MTLVALPPDLGAHPRVLVRGAADRYGEDRVVDWCLALLTGRIRGPQAVSDPSLPSLAWLGGRAAVGDSAWTPADPVNEYWVRVWAARALLYVWRDDAADALAEASADEAWRVREHVARVTAVRGLGVVVEHLLPLLDDPLPRVRTAAVRAVGAAGESEHMPPLVALRNDPVHTVRVAVERAVERLAVRLDRPAADLGSTDEELA